MNYTSMMGSIRKTIGEVAHDIASSQFRYDVLPGKQQLLQEAQERVAKTQDVTTGLQKARNYLINAMASATGDPDYTGGIGMMLRSEKDIDSIVDAQLQVLKNRKIDSTILNDNTVSVVKQKMHDAYAEGMRIAQTSPRSGVSVFEELSTVDKAGQLVQTYFKNPDERVRSNRILGAVGAYGAVSVGGRLMSGGTLSVDRYGRENLAGIPFI